MTQQEIKAVEDYADKISQEPPCSVQSISIQLENRGYLHGLYNGVIQGAQFLDELRKPSEPIFCPTCGYRVRFKGDGTIEQLCNCTDWSKPSEPKTNVGEAGEGLVEKIRNILVSNEKLENVWISPKWSIIPIIGHYQFDKVAKEIAALMQPDKGEKVYAQDEWDTMKGHLETDAEMARMEAEVATASCMELLQAAKDALSTFFSIGCTEEAEIVQVLIKAITNYKKQNR